ncbi:MAG: DNA repair protein RadC, partial [Nitrospinae bacterium]|nr:DNA repair protein RadC [Nitrospinota bacterium]
MAEYREAIKDWPEDERPRERLIKYGAESLSDAQLLAIILRTGNKNRSAVDLAMTLITEFGDFRSMDALSISELCTIDGIGTAKAAQIKASFEIGRRMLSGGGGLKKNFRSSDDVVNYYIPLMKNLKKEVFKTILLDSKNKIIKEMTISEGILTASIVHPREVFNPAIKESAAAVILVHNHPSGDPSPSQEDVEITSRLVKSGEI